MGVGKQLAMGIGGGARNDANKFGCRMGLASDGSDLSDMSDGSGRFFRGSAVSDRGYSTKDYNRGLLGDDAGLGIIVEGGPDQGD